MADIQLKRSIQVVVVAGIAIALSGHRLAGFGLFEILRWIWISVLVAAVCMFATTRHLSERIGSAFGFNNIVSTTIRYLFLTLLFAGYPGLPYAVGHPEIGFIILAGYVRSGQYFVDAGRAGQRTVTAFVWWLFLLWESAMLYVLLSSIYRKVDSYFNESKSGRGTSN